MASTPPALQINGNRISTAEIPTEERLLDTLRWRLGLRGTKEGCRSGDCGACTVLADGETVLSCMVLTHELEGASVTTIEGLSNDPVAHVVRSAFEREQALQCGYCTPGFVVTLTALLKEPNAHRPVADLLEGLQGNLCRCTGYSSIRRAIARAQEGMER